jgi:hypothetical protein
MKQLLLITLLLLINSCDLKLDEEEQKPEEIGLREYLIGQGAKDPRTLNNEEIRIGGLVCDAFTNMRSDVQPSLDVSYKVSEKNCAGVSTSPVTVASRIFSDGDSMLTREGRVHFRDVLSDKHSLLKDMCTNIDEKNSPIDEIKISSVRKIQVHFKIVSNRYYVQIYDFNKNVLTKIHTALVATKDTANSYEGMVITRGLSKACTNSRSVYSYTQELAL